MSGYLTLGWAPRQLRTSLFLKMCVYSLVISAVSIPSRPPPFFSIISVTTGDVFLTYELSITFN